MTWTTHAIQPRIRMTKRSPIPSVNGMPAALDAMTVAKALADHGPRDAGVDGAGPGHDAEESADDQHEQRHVDRARFVARRIEEAGDGREHDVHEALRIRLHLPVGAGDRNVLAERLAPLALVLAGRHEPRGDGDRDDEAEQDGVRARKLQLAGHVESPPQRSFRRGGGVQREEITGTG